MNLEKTAGTYKCTAEIPGSSLPFPLLYDKIMNITVDMDARSAKLALARQKLKTHQEKKQVVNPKDEPSEVADQSNAQSTNNFVEAVAVNDLVTDTHMITQDENELNEVNVHSPSSESSFHKADLNVSEILISTKQKLELQVKNLQSKLAQLENSYTLVVNDNSYSKQQILNLEHEVKTIQERLVKATEENINKERIVLELNNAKTAYNDKNNNLQEQLEFTKSILTGRESENNALRRQIDNLQMELDAIKLQLQQITNGSQGLVVEQKPATPDQNPDVLLQKITSLEQQLNSLQKERDQLSVHYEHYLSELNDQLKVTAKRNYDLEVELQRLTTRESGLIEQISDMEITIQTMRHNPKENIIFDRDNTQDETELNELRENCGNLQGQLETLCKKYEELQIKFTESEAKAQELMKTKNEKYEHDHLSLSKLTADMASDKVAAQRATEQNKKLKKDLQELEEAFVKISRDKLDLTEKVTAEKFLNRELTIKLAEVEEKAKDMHTKLLAKDEEMIRLQNGYREIERKLSATESSSHIINPSINGDPKEDENCGRHDYSNSEGKHSYHNEKHTEETCEHQYLLNSRTDKSVNSKEEAMVKLQDRFLKIMDEVANLSDEKHRLEHIILQLQTETETICEYVALYQQQRSLLKKRDEERSTQIKIFQTECDQLKRQLEELSAIIIRLAQDTELATFFQCEPRQSDLVKVMNLLANLKSNTLIDPCKSSSELKNFHPCSCCSGQLIEV